MAATFGWLCVETLEEIDDMPADRQPPSGGCVLKHHFGDVGGIDQEQPPSGGCVLKPLLAPAWRHRWRQPPSGGCVLKPLDNLGADQPAQRSHLRVAVC